MSTVATICKRIPAGVSVVCPFVLLCPAACPQGTQGGGLASLCPPSEKYASARFPLLARVRDKPAALRLRGAVRVQAGPGKPPQPLEALGCPCLHDGLCGSAGDKTGGVYPPDHWRPVPPPMGAEKGPFSPLIFPLYAVIESRIKGRRRPPEAAKQAENPTESGA